MTGINYLDYSISPVAMRCGFKGCPCRVGCWHLKSCKRLANNPRMSQELRKAYSGEGPPILIQSRLDQILKIPKPSRIGIQFMGDLFDEQVSNSWRKKVFNTAFISPKGHQYFFLTKQVENMCASVEAWKDFFGGQTISKRFYFGVSITSQADADRMIPELLRIPGKKWISIEPMLELIDLRMDGVRCTCGQWEQTPGYFHKTCPDCGKTRHKFIPEWIVLGCESGAKRRPCPHEWMIDVVDQCKAARTPCFVKQIEIDGKVCTDMTKFPKALQVRELP